MSLVWDVLIPAYNAEETITAAVTSAFAQHPRPERVLVYSDGSTDRTVELAREAGAQVIDGIENRGVGHARQALLEHARAPWFLILDADDRLLPDAAQILQRTIEVEPDAWVLGFGDVPDEAALPVTPATVEGGRQVSLRALWQRNPFVSSSSLIRREPAVEAGGFPAVRRLVDYVFWLVLAANPGAAGRLWRYETPLTARAVHGGTITGDVVRAVQDERELLLQHAPAALAGLSAPVRGAIVRARLCELWWRGLSRHTDYGRPSSSYLRPEDVVPGAVMPAVLRMASRSTVQRLLRAAAAGRRASFRLPGGARSQEPASSQAVSGHRAFDVAEPVR